eukprot:jgi/Bigna1/69711/fgenesh1_pg.9_\
MVDSVTGLIDLVEEVCKVHGEAQTADSTIKNRQQCVKLLAAELKRIQSTGLSMSNELMDKMKNTMMKLKGVSPNCEDRRLCFPVYNRKEGDEAETLDKELSDLVQLLQLNMLTPMMGNIERILTMLTEEMKQANEKKKMEEKKSLAERLTSDEKKEIQKLLDGGFLDKDIGNKLLKDIAQTACDVYQAKKERAIIKISLQFVDEEYDRIISRGTFDRKRHDSQKEKMKTGVGIDKLEHWIRPYATQWLQLQHLKKKS